MKYIIIIVCLAAIFLLGRIVWEEYIIPMIGIESAEDVDLVLSICEDIKKNFKSFTHESGHPELILDRISGYTRFYKYIILSVYIIDEMADSDWQPALREWIKKSVHERTNGRWRVQIDIQVRTERRVRESTHRSEASISDNTVDETSGD